MSVTPAHSLILLDKPQGWTSHDVVGRMRRVAGTKRVGHAGTLDPMATGLLLVGIGQGTRLLTHLVGLSKSYTATIRLGHASTTDDADGELAGEKASPQALAAVTPEAIERCLDTLRGDIQQVPSSVSAIKVNGQRAYARVRAGEDVSLEARPVTIDRFDVLSSQERDGYRDLCVIVECSSGTYIRALARDLGEALGVGGHLTALRRTHVGPFAVEQALPVPERSADKDAPQPELPALGLGEAASQVLEVIEVDERMATDLGHGKRPRLQGRTVTGAPHALYAACTRDGALVAVVSVRGGSTLVPELVIPAEART